MGASLTITHLICHQWNILDFDGIVGLPFHLEIRRIECWLNSLDDSWRFGAGTLSLKGEGIQYCRALYDEPLCGRVGRRLLLFSLSQMFWHLSSFLSRTYPILSMIRMHTSWMYPSLYPHSIPYSLLLPSPLSLSKGTIPCPFPFSITLSCLNLCLSIVLYSPPSSFLHRKRDYFVS